MHYLTHGMQALTALTLASLAHGHPFALVPPDLPQAVECDKIDKYTTQVGPEGYRSAAGNVDAQYSGFSTMFARHRLRKRACSTQPVSRGMPGHFRLRMLACTRPSG